MARLPFRRAVVLASREKIRSMISPLNRMLQRKVVWFSLALMAPPGVSSDPSPQPDAASILRGIDAAVQARYQTVLSFTDVEHLALAGGAAVMTMSGPGSYAVGGRRAR